MTQWHPLVGSIVVIVVVVTVVVPTAAGYAAARIGVDLHRGAEPEGDGVHSGRGRRAVR